MRPRIQRQFKQQEARQKNIDGGMPYVSHPRHRQSGSTQHKAPELGFYQVVAPDNAQSQNEPKHNKKIDIKGEAQGFHDPFKRAITPMNQSERQKQYRSKYADAIYAHAFTSPWDTAQYNAFYVFPGKKFPTGNRRNSRVFFCRLRITDVNILPQEMAQITLCFRLFSVGKQPCRTLNKPKAG